MVQQRIFMITFIYLYSSWLYVVISICIILGPLVLHQKVVTTKSFIFLEYIERNNGMDGSI